MKCSICKKETHKTYSFYIKKTSKQSLVNRCTQCVDGWEFEAGMWEEDK